MLTFLQILFIAAAFIRCPCPIVPHITDANLEVAQDWLSYVRLDWSIPVFSEFSNQLCPGFGSHKGVFLWLLSKQQQIPTARTPVTGPAPGLCPCIQGTDVPPELVSQSSGLCLLPPVGLGSNRGTHPHRGAGQTRNPCSRCSASTSACQGLSRGDPEWETAHSRSSLGPTLASSTLVSSSYLPAEKLRHKELVWLVQGQRQFTAKLPTLGVLCKLSQFLRLI